MNSDELLQYEPEITQEDIDAINDYLLSGGFITEFRKTDLFEKKISELAITNYNVISSNNFYSFLELKPITGRKHQLRKQLSFMGNPIVGDKKYNINKTKNKDEKKLMLHAYKIKFLINDKKFTYKAELPDYFNNYLNRKRLII